MKLLLLLISSLLFAASLFAQVSDPLVTVIMPSYQSAQIITSSIESVRHQTYKNWELIIIDDASADNTSAVVEEFSRLDPRIRLIKLKTNGGTSAARNVGLQAKRSDTRFVAFLDNDDLWHPDKLQHQLAFMNAQNMAFSYSGYRVINGDLTMSSSPVTVPTIMNYNKLLGGDPIVLSTVMIDLKQIPDFQFEVGREREIGDWLMWLNLTRSGMKAYGLPTDLTLLRKFSSNQSRNKFHSAQIYWWGLRHHEQLSWPLAFFHFTHYAVSGVYKYAISFRLTTPCEELLQNKWIFLDPKDAMR